MKNNATKETFVCVFEKIKNLMTFEEIDQIQPSARTDSLIAEKIFGCNVGTDTGAFVCECRPAIHGVSGMIPDSHLLPYSSNMGASWQIVEFLSKYHPIVITLRPTDNFWWVIFPDESKHPERSKSHSPDCLVEGFASTAPLAICRAALRLKLNNQERK